MIFKKTNLADAYEIIFEKNQDSRGFFSRIFCKDIMKKYRIENNIAQINNSFSKKKGTLRGFHFQSGKYAEQKIIRCINGKLLNIIIDLRKNSKTFCKYTKIILDSKKRNISVVPRGFANSIMTLDENTEMIYFASNSYNPKAEKGILWNDPYFKIKWPMKPTVISQKDKSHEYFEKNYNNLIF